MMWKALGRIGEGWSGAETRIRKNLEQGIGLSAVDLYCLDVFCPVGVQF